MAESFTGMIHHDLHKYLTGMHEVDDKLPQCQDVEEKSLGWMMYIGMAFNAYVSCLQQLYLFGAAVQLKRMGYHMTKIGN